MRSDGHDPASAATSALGRAVRARRRALGLGQAEVCALAGVGPAFLYELEHGKPTLRLDKLLDVLAVLGLELRLHAGKERLVVDSELRASPP